MAKRVAFGLAGLAALLGFTVGAAQAASVTVYSNTFESETLGGLPSDFTGSGSVQGTQGFSGVSSFGSQFLRNFSTVATTLTLTGLQSHTSVSLGFLLGIIDSWDGSTGGGCCNPDFFNVEIDGASVFSNTFDNVWGGPGTDGSPAGLQGYSPPAGGILSSYSNLGFNGGWNDTGYNMALEAAFQNIAHTSSTLTISWFADGGGYQGGDLGGGDESWAIDDVVVRLDGVTDPCTGDCEPVATPEPASLALFGLGLAGLATLRRRRN